MSDFIARLGLDNKIWKITENAKIFCCKHLLSRNMFVVLNRRCSYTKHWYSIDYIIGKMNKQDAQVTTDTYVCIYTYTSKGFKNLMYKTIFSKKENMIQMRFFLTNLFRCSNYQDVWLPTWMYVYII